MVLIYSYYLYVLKHKYKRKEATGHLFSMKEAMREKAQITVICCSQLNNILSNSTQMHERNDLRTPCKKNQQKTNQRTRP